MKNKPKNNKATNEESLLKKLEPKKTKARSKWSKKSLLTIAIFSVIIVAITFIIFRVIPVQIEKQSYKVLSQDAKNIAKSLRNEINVSENNEIALKKGCWRPEFKYGEGEPTCRINYSFDSTVSSEEELVNRSEKFSKIINNHGAFRKGNDKNLYKPPLLTTDISQGIYVDFFVHQPSDTGCVLWNVLENKNHNYSSKLSTSFVCTGKAKKLHF